MQQPIEYVFQEQQDTQKLKSILTQIYNKANASLYYNNDKLEFQRTLKDIEKLIKEAGL